MKNRPTDDKFDRVRPPIRQRSTLSDTYYIFPVNLRNCVTKIALATEELHDFHRKKGSAREEGS